MKRVLIVGGTGRLGSKLKELLIDCEVFTLSRRELVNNANHISANISTFTEYQNFDTVINCAAMKDVAKCEDNIAECVSINYYGTLFSLQSAQKAGVKRYIYISTDMSVEPQSVYGASKKLADATVTNFASNGQMQTAVIRLGNIIAKEGSILTVLANRAKELGFIPITDSSMTRFLMTDKECVEFVISVLKREKLSGEIYAPKCKSYRITDVAQAVAPEYPIKIVGLRPGDMFEVIMVAKQECARTREEGSTYIIEPEWKRLNFEPELYEKRLSQSLRQPVTSSNNQQFATVQELRELYLGLLAK